MEFFLGEMTLTYVLRFVEHEYEKIFFFLPGTRQNGKINAAAKKVIFFDFFIIFIFFAVAMNFLGAEMTFIHVLMLVERKYGKIILPSLRQSSKMKMALWQ